MDKAFLGKFWKKNIQRNIYRVVSDEYASSIKKNGMTPAKDPFKGMHPKIKALYRLMLKLEKEGLVYREKWRDGPVKASYIIKVSRASMDNNYIDFVADYKQALRFKGKWKGGALTNVVFNFCRFLLLNKAKLSGKEQKLVCSLFEWTKKKMGFRNRIMVVKGSSRCFETAKLLLLPKDGRKQYLASPYGSFKHFLKTVRGRFAVYEPYLSRTELGYLRVLGRIGPKEIVRIS
ncbi:MAG TPA: hypothetical protein HA362_00275 [Nanoarchaeota archaeon]|nr:hypothetical protein [Nanoarchaeota archaeon]